MKYRFNKYGIEARLDAIFHKIFHPTHKIYWRLMANEICDGDIVCNTCECIFWCRTHDLSIKELNKRLANIK